MFLALASITRLYALLIIFLFAVYILQRWKLPRDLIWCVLGIVVVGIPLMIVYLIVTGDPMLPLKAMFGFYASPERSEGARLLYYPGLIWRIKSQAGIFPLFFSIAAVTALVRPNKKRLVLIAWIAPLLIYLEFGSMSFEYYVPIFKRTRFLTPNLR